MIGEVQYEGGLYGIVAKVYRGVRPIVFCYHLYVGGPAKPVGDPGTEYATAAEARAAMDANAAEFNGEGN